MKIYTVQGDPRDHHGELLLVTADKERAERYCKKLILQWNKPDNELEPLQKVERMIRADGKRMSTDEFLDKYLGSAWITSPVLSETAIRVAKSKK